MQEGLILAKFAALEKAVGYSVARTERAEILLMQLLQVVGLPHHNECAAVKYQKEHEGQQNGDAEKRPDCDCPAQGPMKLVQQIQMDHRQALEARQQMVKLVKPVLT